MKVKEPKEQKEIDTDESNKRQKVEEVDEMDDLFGEASDFCSKVVDKISDAADDGGEAKIDSTLQVPEGRLLAYNPGKTNVVKAVVLSSSHKSNEIGPTSVKISAKVLNIKNPGADIVREGPVMAIAMTKDEKVQTQSGVDVNARLIATDTTPVLSKSTEVFNITLTLGKITQKGLKEKAVNEICPGVEVELIDVKLQTSGMGIPWLTCTDFKVTNKTTRADGVTTAVDAVVKGGDSLVLSSALNSVAFRSDAAPTPESKPSFDQVKSLANKTKTSVVEQLKANFPQFSESPDPLLFESSDLQIPPVFAFHKTKVAVPKSLSKGMLLNDAKLAIYHSRTGDSDALAQLFGGGAIVASEFGSERSYMEAKISGPMHVIPTKQMYVPTIGLLKAHDVFAPANILTINGPVLKIPLAVLAAPFGVNERTTADLLMDNVMPVANMIFTPAKSKIYQAKHDNPDYTQDIYIDTSHFTVDVRTTLRNVGLCLSHGMVSSMYSGAEFNESVSIAGESLIDMMGGDHKPSLLTFNGLRITSLRQAGILLKPSLEYYAVVPDAIKIAQAEGNIHCGTDSAVGDAAFLKAGGGSVEGCAAMLKKGELAVFAIQTKKATMAVETE